MLCKNCKKEISSEDLFCRYCGERQNLEGNNVWDNDQYKNYTIESCGNIPNVIKDEYDRIFKLLDEGQSYGAVLQMRDVYEICLKLPAIIGIVFICNKSKLEEVDYNILSVVIEKELSSGTWHKIVRNLIDNIEEQKLKLLLQESDELWSWDGTKGIRGKRKAINGYTGFVHWRNATIGHGALAFDNQEEYYLQFKNMVEKLYTYCKNVDSVYSSIVFSDYYKKVTINAMPIELSPFIVNTDEGTFLFDAYLYGKKKYDILNYKTAKKRSYRHDTKEEQDLEKLYIKTKNYIENIILTKIRENTSNTLYSDWHTLQEEQMLDDKNNKTTYKKIYYLTSWVKNSIKDNRIALVAMQSGLGKSSWCRTFDEKYTSQIDRICGFDVKVVYINRFYNKSVNSILTSIEDVLTLSPSGQRKIKLDNPRYIDRQAVEKKQELADYIKYYYEKMHEVGEWKEDGLLLIIDGLDEIHEGNILDWLPSEEMLGDSIRLLLTVRLNNEFINVKSLIENNLKTKFDENNLITVTNNSEQNIEVLTDYIMDVCESENIPVSQNDICTLLKKSKNKFLYLNGLLQLIKSNKACISEEDYYLEMLVQLRSMYSDKFFVGIENTIGLLALIGKSISIKELAQLLGDEEPGYLLAAYLRDLQAFLAIEYRDGEQFYSLIHEEVILSVRRTEWYNEQQYIKLMKNCLMDSAEQLTRIEKDHLIGLKYDDFEGAIYVFKNLHLLPKGFIELFSEDELVKLLNGWADICSWIADLIIYNHLDVKAKYNIINNIYSICKTLFDDKQYIMFETYLRMVLLSPEFIAFYHYGDDDLKYDIQLKELLLAMIWTYEEKNMSNEELNIYERELMIYPIYSGRLALKGILLNKTDSKEKLSYKEKLADSLKLAMEVAESIAKNTRFSKHDCNRMDDFIREIASSVYTMVDKKTLAKYKISNIKTVIMNTLNEQYQFDELYKRSILLNIEVAQYVQNSAIISRRIKTDADCLYEDVLMELDKTCDKKGQQCLVSYFPPIVISYMLLACSNNHGFLDYLSREKYEMLDRVETIYELYDKYDFVSHEFQHYINTLVTIGNSAYNGGNKEKAETYLKKAISKFDYYKRQPYYREMQEILFDVCNANYTLSMYYTLDEKEVVAMKYLKNAQRIFQENIEVRKMFSIRPDIVAHLNGKPAETIQIGKVKIGRNDMCPCGSGKKYKKCCGR